MSMWEWPDYLREAVIAEGMETRWQRALNIKSKRARNQAKLEIKRRVMKRADERVARMYLELGPLLAEHKAISKAADKYPEIRDVAPELLARSEALALFKQEAPDVTDKELQKLWYFLGASREMLYNDKLDKDWSLLD